MKRYLGLATGVVLLASAAWAQNLSERRSAPQPAVPQTLRILNQRLPEVAFRDTPFDQVMEFIGELTKVNVVVRWQTLEDAGVKRDTPISLQARNLRLSQVLWLIMNEAGGSDLKLAYRMSGNLLVLSTEADLDKEMVTKVYDVSDLLIRVRNVGRSGGFDVGQAMQQTGQQGGGGSSGLFGQQNANQQQQGGNEYGQNAGAGGAPEMKELVDLIQDTIEPDTWVTKGGNGTIHAFRGLLVIHNTILVHQRLGGYVTENEIGP
jgi:hypothetical protein